jgi:small subunit ribosomal protein S20
VAHSLSAKKRIRQNVKQHGRNRWRKDAVKDAVKAFQAALESGKKDEAAALLKACFKKLDQVAAKGTLHKNTADRKKSRLAKALNKAK